MKPERFGTIDLLPNGVEIIFPDKRRVFRRKLRDRTLTFNWSDVTKVVAFKRDCFTVDNIRLAFEIDGELVVEIHEDMPGWTELLDALHGHLSGALPLEAWWAKVAFPPFELCLTTLYTRAG
jgi:hypothetical protein